VSRLRRLAEGDLRTRCYDGQVILTHWLGTQCATAEFHREQVRHHLLIEDLRRSPDATWSTEYVGALS
jgi:hypothetical protein